jgi:hypothetical protein
MPLPLRIAATLGGAIHRWLAIFILLLKDFCSLFQFFPVWKKTICRVESKNRQRPDTHSADFKHRGKPVKLLADALIPSCFTNENPRNAELEHFPAFHLR